MKLLWFFAILALVASRNYKAGNRAALRVLKSQRLADGESENLVSSLSRFLYEEREQKQMILGEVRKHVNDVTKMKGVRLIGADGHPAKYFGRVEVFMHGQWGTVCDDYATNGLARTVCRSLFGEEDLQAQVITNTYEFNETTIPFPIWMDDVKCTGEELSIYDCERSWKKHDCSHKEDVAVNCGPPDIVDEGPTEGPAGNGTSAGVTDATVAGTDAPDAATGAPDAATEAAEAATEAPARRSKMF